LPAIFNRALAREHMKAYNQAAEDWELYIEKESDPEWKSDAARHLDEIKLR
jgi:hypothetical protein